MGVLVTALSISALSEFPGRIFVRAVSFSESPHYPSQPAVPSESQSRCRQPAASAECEGAVGQWTGADLQGRPARPPGSPARVLRGRDECRGAAKQRNTEPTSPFAAAAECEGGTAVVLFIQIAGWFEGLFIQIALPVAHSSSRARPNPPRLLRRACCTAEWRAWPRHAARAACTCALHVRAARAAGLLVTAPYAFARDACVVRACAVRQMAERLGLLRVLQVRGRAA